MALLAIEAHCRLTLEGKPSDGTVLPELLEALKQRFPNHADTFLAEANAQLVGQGSDADRLDVLNQLFTAHGLSAITQRNTDATLSLDNLTTHNSPLTTHNPPLISVIIPLYNASHTISTALSSLFEQQGVRLEIVVVDDASEDDGVLEVARWQRMAPMHVIAVVSFAT